MTQPLRVLLCDDHRVVRRGLARLLAADDRVDVVGEAGDGAEAVAAALEHRPDVILMDLMMPNVDGIEATRQIVRQFPQARVLVLTSFSDGDQIRAAIDAGASGYALKDSHPEDLVRAIESVARGEVPLDPRAARAWIDQGRGEPEAAAEPGEDAVPVLSPREREVLELLGTGLSNKAIGARLGIGESTVKTYLNRIYRQMGVSGRIEAALLVGQQDPPA